MRMGLRSNAREIKGIEAQRNLAIAEFRAEDIPGGEQRAEPAVARIAAVFGVVAEHAANLAGFVVAAEGRAGGYADHAIEGDSALHQHVDDSGGEEAAHSSAL